MRGDVSYAHTRTTCDIIEFALFQGRKMGLDWSVSILLQRLSIWQMWPLNSFYSTCFSEGISSRFMALTYYLTGPKVKALKESGTSSRFKPYVHSISAHWVETHIGIQPNVSYLSIFSVEKFIRSCGFGWHPSDYIHSMHLEAWYGTCTMFLI